VAPLDPWIAIAAAVSRTKDERAPWHPEQQLPAVVALRSSTEGVARVATGGAADLVLVDDDPLHSSASDLRRMRVALTVRAGEITHEAL
jgi:predicted amidohydrolase YtcJ